MYAGVAQLVEYKLPKLGVASSNLVARSSSVIEIWVVFFSVMPYHQPQGEVDMKWAMPAFFYA